MKKTLTPSTSKKLTLHRVTVRALTDLELAPAVGGGSIPPTARLSCVHSCVCPKPPHTV